MKLIICKGLPASGKTTWAKEYVRTHRSTIRVNRDDLRLQLFDGEFSRSRETIIKAARDAIVEMALKHRQNVVVDDTNLHESNESQLRSIAAQFDAAVEIQEFNVSVKECIRRDSKRPKPVGETVITDMAARFGLL